MHVHPLRILTGDFPSHRFLAAIFLEEEQRGLVTTRSFGTAEAALSGAESDVLRNLNGYGPPIALVLRAGRRPPEAIARKRKAIGRILSRINPENWHMTLADPNVDAWVLADPVVRAEFEADEVTREDRHRQGDRIIAIAKRRPIDRQMIAAFHPEFVELLEYIREKTAIPQPTA